MKLQFLTIDRVLSIHGESIRGYGGSTGIRDLGLLESALAMPEATYGGELLHPTLPEMAAAYLYHVAKNHPFVDGNKRTALACALVFLGLNGEPVDAPDDAVYELTLGIADGSITKAEAATRIAAWLSK